MAATNNTDGNALNNIVISVLAEKIEGMRQKLDAAYEEIERLNYDYARLKEDMKLEMDKLEKENERLRQCLANHNQVGEKEACVCDRILDLHEIEEISRIAFSYGITPEEAIRKYLDDMADVPVGCKEKESE